MLHGCRSARVRIHLSNTIRATWSTDRAGRDRRKSGPVGLEKMTPEDPFLAKGVRSSPTVTMPISSATISKRP
jgi:hypothetical protein